MEKQNHGQMLELKGWDGGMRRTRRGGVKTDGTNKWGGEREMKRMLVSVERRMHIHECKPVELTTCNYAIFTQKYV